MGIRCDYRIVKRRQELPVVAIDSQSHAYLPQDRLRALARGETLPERTTGSALFADISGFTPLTEALQESLGPRQGAEELTRHLDKLYTALIDDIERFDGSVISFAGDAITCWFDDAHGPAALRAVACAAALQQAMGAFATITFANNQTAALALKVAVASGPARRFVVGDPKIHYIDVLAGATVARASAGEHLAQRGEVLLDEATVLALDSALTAREWRTNPDTGERFAVQERFAGIIEPVVRRPAPELAGEALLQWLHKSQVEREKSFLTEFRPCAVLFVRFAGIDFDSDNAPARLDAFMRQMQGVAARYEGAILQLTIGDKGSYAYLNFGALYSHEDDARRAVKTALALRNQSDLQLQIGITQGVLRVGAYGGRTRRTHGALGDDVNLAARLMMTAAAGEILISGQVYKAVAKYFVADPRPPVPMKGKTEPLPVFAVSDERQQQAVRLQEPTYALPMVGRTRELQIANEQLELALQGRSQLIGIVAEAGMGKSRLVAEVIRAARKKGFTGFGGACQSDAVNTPYQAWKSIWQAFFSVDLESPLEKQMRWLENEIADKAPERVQALPLLGILLDLEIPDNDFTKSLEPKYRQSVLRALLEACLRGAAQAEPLLFVIEDLHWIDALSHDLLEELARALTDSRICFVLAYRPPQLARLEAQRIEAMQNFIRIELHELNAAEAEQAIRAKLAQLYPARVGPLPDGLVETLMARAQGNPFYLEELLNYVRDRGLDPAGLDQIQLPDSLHALILSRLDALTEQEKTILRVASIVGRLFRAAWLTGYYPELGPFPEVKTALDTLGSLDITPLDTPEPEWVYLFRHIVTHEVTYESLPFATRARLHERLAEYLEEIDAPVDAIAFHFGRSNNSAKQQVYWLKAGDAAYEAFANEAALAYYGRLSPHLSDSPAQADINLKQATAYFALGRMAEAREYLTLVFAGLGQPLPSTRWRLAGGLLWESVRQVLLRLRFARQPVMADPFSTDQEPDPPIVNVDLFKLIRAYLLLTMVNISAIENSLLDVYASLRALNLSEAAQVRSPELAQSYAHVGYGMSILSHRLARGYIRRADASLVGLENLSTAGSVLLVSSIYALCIGDWPAGERSCARALEISDRLGDRANWAHTLSVLGYITFFQGKFERSLQLFIDHYQEGLAQNHVQFQAMALASQVWVSFMRGQTTQALAIAEGVLPLFALGSGTAIPESVTHGILASAHVREGQFNQARQAATTASALLARAPIGFYPDIFTYGYIAEVYLALWDREKHQKTNAAAEFRRLARQTCRSMRRLARWFPVGRSRAWLLQGVFDWVDGRPGRANRAWQKSLVAAQKLGMPYDEALAYHAMGQYAAGTEQAANLARAGEIFDRLGVVRGGGWRFGEWSWRG